MTVIVPITNRFASVESSGVDDCGFQAVQTLQELLDIAPHILKPYGIDHAVVFNAPDSANSLLLPLLSLDDGVRTAVGRAIQAGVHPALQVKDCERSHKLCSPVRVKLRSASDPLLEQLRCSYRVAGLDYVYVMPLANVDGMAFYLEVARADAALSNAELSELQAIAHTIPDRLPSYMLGAPCADDDWHANYAVR